MYTEAPIQTHIDRIITTATKPDKACEKMCLNREKGAFLFKVMELNHS